MRKSLHQTQSKMPFAIFLPFLLTIMFALPAHAQSCCSTYVGYVYINGTLAANGTVVQTRVNSDNVTNVTNFTVGDIGDKGQGYYIVNVPGNPGDNVSFFVNSMTVIAMNGTNASAQPWGIGWHPFNLTMNTSSNGVACFSAGGCTSGFCTDGYCCNSACTGSSEDCNVAGSLGTCTSTAPSGGGGGSSGAGAVGGNVESSGASDSNLQAGESGSFVFTQTPIVNIEVKAADTILSGTITVKEVTKPAEATVAISSGEGSVYKYMEIIPSFTNNKISEAKIEFKVPKAWFTANGIAPETTTLKKLVGKQWVALPTQQLKFDGTNYVFEATTSGFSVYVVTGSKKVTFFDLINKIDQYYKGQINFFDLIGLIDSYYRTQ